MFFSQKDTLALKIRKFQKEILDSLNTPINNEILYIFLKAGENPKFYFEIYWPLEKNRRSQKADIHDYFDGV